MSSRTILNIGLYERICFCIQFHFFLVLESLYCCGYIITPDLFEQYVDDNLETLSELNQLRQSKFSKISPNVSKPYCN